MQVGNFKFHRRAVTAFQQLESDEQARVREALAALADVPASQWPAAQAKRLSGDPPLYLVHGDDGLRLFVQAAEGQEPEVMDIVLRPTPEASSQGPGKNGR
jgi:hypothetical protein